jgi:sulfite exporter TauE/SafE
MSLLPDIPNPYLTALVGGLFYGFAVCTSARLPYITSYIAGIGAGFRKGVAITMILDSARIVAHALVGAAIGGFKLLVSDAILNSFQKHSSYALALVTRAVGISIVLKVKETTPSCDCNSGQNKMFENKKKTWRRFDLRAFSLSLSRGLLICTLLFMLLLCSVPFAAPADSLFLAVLFAVGTALSPMLFLGGATGRLLNKAPLLRKWISISGGGLLVVLGLFTLISTTTII